MIQLIKKIETTIKNLIKIANLLTVDDSLTVRFGTVELHGKTQKVMIFSPYGLMHNPPKDSLSIVFSLNAQESNYATMSDYPQSRTLKSLAPGEVALGNYVTGNYLYFDQNAKATLVCNDLDALVANTTYLSTTDLNIEVSNATTIQTKALTATVTDDCTVTATNINLTATGNVSMTGGGNVTIGATGVLGLSGASLSMAAGGASMGMSPSGDMSINSNSLAHNGTNIGDDHYHSQAADSGGDTEQDTGGPQ